MSASVLVIGSYVQDLTFYVNRFPSPGETLQGAFASGPGGKGSNQAIAATRTGIKTAFVGAVGQDLFGEGAKKFHTEEGVEHHFLTIADTPTGTAGILVNKDGQNSIVVALGANEKFTAEEVNPAWMESAEIVVMQLEIHPQTVHDLLTLARKRGRTTIFNPAPMQSGLNFSMLESVDIFIPNETEFVAVMQEHPAIGDTAFSLEKLTALSSEELHLLCRKLKVSVVIVTLGSRGCFISQEDSFEIVPVCEGIKVVDTTGAGDAFVGGFASGMVQFKGDVIRAAKYGTVVAGLSVTRRGTASSMPLKMEIEELWALQQGLLAEAIPAV